MNKKIIYLLIVTMVPSILLIPVADVFGYSFVGVTSNGVEFPILSSDSNDSNDNDSNDSNNSSNNGTSILDGIGVYLTIQNRDVNGVVYFGDSSNNHSYSTDIRQYVAINESDNWGIVISDDDYIETLYIPEFGVQYSYDSGMLHDVTVPQPNILGYTESRILSGDITVINNDDGIFFSGDGEIIIQLHDYSESLFLRGDGTINNVIKIVTSDFDLMNESYIPNLGYVTYSNSIDPGENSFSVTGGIDSVHTGVLTFDAYAFYNGNSCTAERDSENYGRVGKDGDDPCLYKTINRPSISTTLVETNYGDHYTITGDSTTIPLMTMWNWYHGQPFAYDQYNNNFYFEMYDTLPSVQLASYSEGNFEELLEFPSDIVYLYVKLDGGTSNIKGESFDIQSDVFFSVNNLPEDIAYDVSKSGIVGIVGKTSSTGEISLLSDDVDFGISTSTGGILHLYPESISYVGNYDNIMFDVLHDGIIQLPEGEDLIYIPQNYIYWVFPISVEVDNVRIDNISLDYLNKNYTNNESLLIPIVPSGEIIHLTINGEDIQVLMRDVATSTQIKQVPILSSTTSDYTVDGSASTTSNISTSTFLTATHTGMMNVNFDFKVGGSVDFSMDSSYTGGFSSSTSCKWHGASSPARTFSCNNYSTPNDPDSITNIDTLTADHQSQLISALHNGQVSNLTVEVDILRNMVTDEDFESILIYESNLAQASVTSTLDVAGYGASNQVHLTYPMDLVNYNLAIPVTVGDMVEFVVRVNLQVSGSPTIVSDSAVYSSYVVATTEFGGGIISVGMS